MVAVHPGPLPGELATIEWLQALPEPVPSLAEVVRLTTSTEANLVVGALLAWLLFRRLDRRLWSVTAVALVFMLAVQPLTKSVVDRPRPNSAQVDVRASYESLSFPSGHSLSTTTVFGALAAAAWYRGRRGCAVVAALPILLTGFASGVQGVHWPSDAVGGTLVGAVAAGLIARRVDD